MTKPTERLRMLHSSLQNAEPEEPLLGTLKLGPVEFPVRHSAYPERLPRVTLDPGQGNLTPHLIWLAQKFALGQDCFLLSPPGPFARRLALTFLGLINTHYEIVSLHRDVGESELKQGREIRAGGQLVYVDGPAVRAAKTGGVLILEGIEKCERGVLPILNNLLENREINLEDGTHIVAADRYEKMVKAGQDTSTFIPAHPAFRVIAIGCPVPPYTGYPLDPPFRSRFQVRYLDPLSSAEALSNEVTQNDKNVTEFVGKISEAIQTLQLTKEMRTRMATGVSRDDEVPGFPQTALLKLTAFLTLFPLPSPEESTLSQFKYVLQAIHPALAYGSDALWKALQDALVSADLGPYAKGFYDLDVSKDRAAQQGAGLWGWKLKSISRKSKHVATVVFERGTVTVSHDVPAGPLPLASFPLENTSEVKVTNRFLHLLTTLLQLHALKLFDINVAPPSASLQSASASTNLLIDTFARVLGYELETVHLYKELSGRELWMRRVVERGQSTGSERTAGLTSWEPSLLVQSALEGKLLHLEGIDTIGATVGSMSRFFNDREVELWEGRRIVNDGYKASLDIAAELTEGESSKEPLPPLLSHAHPSFRVITTSSKSTPAKEWLTEELSSALLALPTLAMPIEEEKQLLLDTGCAPEIVDQLIMLAGKYRTTQADPSAKTRRLGTASLIRIAKRLAVYPFEPLLPMVERTLLVDFLPTTTKGEVKLLFSECGIKPTPNFYHPPPKISADKGILLFPAASAQDKISYPYEVPLFDPVANGDVDGAGHVPFMTNYMDNSQQTILMKDIAVDLEIMRENVLLLGNQGVGKNKIIDRLLQLLNKPREYIQLHRDSTTQSLMFQTTLDNGVLNYVDSPLLRAIQLGRVIVIDEVDKAPTPVVAGLASLAARGEMTLSDGRSVKPWSRKVEGQNDASTLYIHPNFRMILLANRPGLPFLGNAFLRVLGDTFSCYAVGNPDESSEVRVLSELAPELEAEILTGLVRSFNDLRVAFDDGTISYPFSLRELLAIVRHMKRFPDDSLEQVLRNVFDFDVNRPETIDTLYGIMRRHKLPVKAVGLDAVRQEAEAERAGERPGVIDFEPKNTSLDEPKHGKDTTEEHHGGNSWAGGTGGRDTAGLGGVGGYKRLYLGHKIHQVSDKLKGSVPQETLDKAREMARKELAAKLHDIDLTSGEAQTYSAYYNAVQSHISQLTAFLDNLDANKRERVWLKRQTDGELDEHRIAEGLTGEAGIYKRRGHDEPEVGRPQLKPKRIRFIFDLSASMYRNQFDGRLARSLETAVMVLESFARLTRKEKYSIDMYGQSGEEAEIPLTLLGDFPDNAGDRFKVIQKMTLIPQYCWSGDHTLESIQLGVKSVLEEDADDYFVIVITDAQFDRYSITPQDLNKALNSNKKVKCSMISIGEGAETDWLPQQFPGQAYSVRNTSEIATTFRAILSQMLGAEL